MRKYLYLTIAAMLIIQTAEAQKSLFSKEVFINGGDSLLYRQLLPENFDPAKKYPVLIFLHGSGERGNDNEAQLVHGTDFFLNQQARKNFPAIIIFPQCPGNDFWANVIFGDSNAAERFSFQKGSKPTKVMGLLGDFIKQLKSEKFADTDRFYVGGLSMGGMGTLELLRHHPRVFAAAFSICGGDHVENVRKYKNVPIWFFHGAKDNVVPPEKSEVVVAELKRRNSMVKFTLYPEANHNSWDSAFAEPELLPWLFSQKK